MSSSKSNDINNVITDMLPPEQHTTPHHSLREHRQIQLPPSDDDEALSSIPPLESHVYPILFSSNKDRKQYNDEDSADDYSQSDKIGPLPLTTTSKMNRKHAKQKSNKGVVSALVFHF